MPRTPKTIKKINGVKHWNCYMCKKILPETDYPKRSDRPHAKNCKKCSIAYDKESQGRRNKRRQMMKIMEPEITIIDRIETDEDYLKSLQAFDPSWTMGKLQKAMKDPQ